MDVTASQLINMYAIKYHRLKELSSAVFPNLKQPEQIHIYIDLNKILARLYSNPTCHLSKDLILGSDIINLAGHYRGFFKSYVNLPCKVHLIFGSYVPRYNLNVYPEYNSRKITKIINDDYTKNIITDNLDIVETISKYLNNLYYHTTRYESGVVIYDIKNRYPNDLHIIITGDHYNYQLVDDNCIIFRPLKVNKNGQREDLSYIITKDNNIQTYCIEKKYKIENNEQIKLGLNGGLYSLFLAYNGAPCRDISSMRNRASVILKNLHQLVKSNTLLNTHNNLLDTDDIFVNSDMSDLYNRYCAIDIPTQYENYKHSADIDKIDFNDYTDPETVEQINNNYYKDFPILLDNFM